MKKWVVNGCYYDDSEIEKAKDDFRFFNAGDYITKEMANSKEKIFEYIEQLENAIQALKQVHEYDVKIIDEVKGNAVKLYKEIDELKEDKQKLIEKLEKEITVEDISINLTKLEKILYKDIIEIVFVSATKLLNLYRNEILSIVKGE